jgi:hypothetical protein
MLDRPVEQVSDTTWHIGIRIDQAGGRKDYHELNLDEDRRVVSLDIRSAPLEAQAD